METFKQTSDALYDRHHYKLVYSNNQSITLDSWEELRQCWFNTPPLLKSHVEVLDIPNKKRKKSNGGFK
jgi:hypothetical protein